jgi:pyrimidine operon attenuation protein/uracil phosphoribosyltransferase
MTQTPARQLLDSQGVASAIDRMADAMAGVLKGKGPLFLAGIPTRGTVVAQKLAEALSVRGIDCRCGKVDIAMYRDDLGMREGVDGLRGTDLPMDLEKWTIMLTDDVQHTGRTARAAIEAVLAYGRPRRILYAVLADRGGRELPVRPDFTGVELNVDAASRVRVRFSVTDAGEEGIFES